MAHIIAFSNQKGGVGKTTTASAVAVSLKNRGYNVLAVDLDPQANLSDSAGADTINVYTVYELLKKEIDAADAIQELVPFNLISSNILLASAEQEITQLGREYRLKEGLEQISDNYDYIIIDTPPSLGLFTVNAFTCADEVIIPTTPGIFAAKGIYELHKSISAVKEYCNPKLKIGGILITRYNPRTNISRELKELTEQIGDKIGANIYSTFIRSSVKVEEAQANQQDLFAYNAKSAVTGDYNEFVDEYLKKFNEGKDSIKGGVL